MRTLIDVADLVVVGICVALLVAMVPGVVLFLAMGAGQ